MEAGKASSGVTKMARGDKAKAKLKTKPITLRQ
jgi:hypothetical protein